MTDTLRISEIFGPTIQGEGPFAGHSARFCRFTACNFTCPPCDTRYSWDPKDPNWNPKWLTVPEILKQLLPPPPGDSDASYGKPDVAIWVLTGGEPLIQQYRPAFAELLSELAGRRPVHIETNGSMAPSPAVVEHVKTWVVSPKLPYFGAHRSGKLPGLHRVWRGGAYGAYLKIVCRDEGDVRDALGMADAADWPRTRVWLMPEGDNAETVSARWGEIVACAAERGVNATHRLHLPAGVR